MLCYVNSGLKYTAERKVGSIKYEEIKCMLREQQSKLHMLSWKKDPLLHFFSWNNFLFFIKKRNREEIINQKYIRIDGKF